MEQVTIGLAQLSEVRRLEVLKRFVHGLTYVNDELGITYDYLMSDEWSEWFSRANLILWEQRIKYPSSMVWVARTSGNLLVGFLVAEKNQKQPHQEVRSMYVHPDYQGQGVAGRLMAEAYSWFDMTRWTQLFVATYGHQAIRFYWKHGFQIKQSITPPSYGKVPLVAMVRTPWCDECKEAA
jgi:GNAT superfamily N-acetyltransferase